MNLNGNREKTGVQGKGLTYCDARVLTYLATTNSLTVHVDAFLA